ncbi:MAG TPA: hypothetical protein VLW50_19120 [Streptosporangiaceae bacterium]|nr:hypothetical protein [Streptosporangiaceae bacterium]
MTARIGGAVSVRSRLAVPDNHGIPEQLDVILFAALERWWRPNGCYRRHGE